MNEPIFLQWVTNFSLKSNLTSSLCNDLSKPTQYSCNLLSSLIDKQCTLTRFHVLYADLDARRTNIGSFGWIDIFLMISDESCRKSATKRLDTFTRELEHFKSFIIRSTPYEKISDDLIWFAHMIFNLRWVFRTEKSD